MYGETLTSTRSEGANPAKAMQQAGMSSAQQAEVARRIRRRLNALQNGRRSWESHWKQLASHFLPRKSRFLSDGNNNGAKADTRLYDSTGVIAARNLASGMQGGLTSPGIPWFRLSWREAAFSISDESRAWLHDTQERMNEAFSHSNFYEQIHALYAELAVMGTGCLLVEEDKDRIMRFKILTAGEYYIDAGAFGRIDTLYLRLSMTARQIVGQWPDTSPAHIREAAVRDDNSQFTIIHAIEPRKDARRHGVRGDERPFSSIFLLEGSAASNGGILETGGYYEFPALCPRWDSTGGDVYGRSPAMDALADCRMLQRIRRDTLQALSREVRPPLNVTSGALSIVPDVSPDAINYIPSGGQAEAVTPLYQVRSNLQAAEATIQGCRTQIREAFFNDLFMLLKNTDQRMTATEVAERNAEKMLMLGPVLDRLRSEVFQPLVERVYGLMARAGHIAPPPPSMQGGLLTGHEQNKRPVRVEFVSILAQAQKAAGIGAVTQTVSFAAKLAEIAPQTLDKIDTDEALDEVATMLGVPPGLIRGRQTVAALRQQRATETAQAKAVATLKEGVELAGEVVKLGKPQEVLWTE